MLERRRNLVAAASALVLVGVALPLPHALASTVTLATTRIDTWPVPETESAPYHIIYGPDGNLWAWCPDSDQVLRFNTTDGALISTYNLTAANHSNMVYLASGAD